MKLKWDEDVWAILVAAVLLLIGLGLATMFFASAYKLLTCS